MASILWILPSQPDIIHDMDIIIASECKIKYSFIMCTQDA